MLGKESEDMGLSFLVDQRRPPRRHLEDLRGLKTTYSTLEE